jgi:hypothetical protein
LRLCRRRHIPAPETASARIQSCACEHQRRFAVELICAALGHDIDNAADRTAVFSLKAAALDLDFFDEFERDGTFTARAALRGLETSTPSRNELVLGTAGPINRVASYTAAGLLPLVPVEPG